MQLAAHRRRAVAAEYDTTTQLESYLTIPSLQTYLLVSHRERRLTVHTREPNGSFTTRVAIAGGKLRIAPLDVDILVDDVYRGSQIAG